MEDLQMPRIPLPVLIVVAITAIALGFVFGGPKPPTD
jgi:hypothetical protein